MVVNIPKKIAISDLIFRNVYFDGFVNEICSWEEYRQLKELTDKLEYSIWFDFSKTKSFFTIIYFIEIEVQDKSNQLVSVPENSEFYDILFNLCASGSALQYNTLNRKFLKGIDAEEIKDDFRAIIKYLNHICSK
jgi:hypothetical protein